MRNQHKLEAYEQIERELIRQRSIHGNNEHPLGDWANYTFEEIGEAIKSQNEGDLIATANELIQTMAMSLVWYDAVREKLRTKNSIHFSYKGQTLPPPTTIYYNVPVEELTDYGGSNEGD